MCLGKLLNALKFDMNLHIDKWGKRVRTNTWQTFCYYGCSLRDYVNQDYKLSIFTLKVPPEIR